MIELPTAQHGQFTSDQPPPYTEGTQATLACDPGYGHDRPSSTLLQGQWHPPSATCLPLLTDVPLVPNGGVIGPSPPPYPPHAQVRVECLHGYWSPVTAFTAVVREGQWVWDPPAAECVPVVQSLPVATHGHFEGDRPPPYPGGSTATLVCDPGYATRQPIVSQLSMEDDWLEWFPDSATCEPVLQALPPAEDSGTFEDVPGPYFEGTVVPFHCGYGSDSSTTAVLQPDGTLQWQPPSGKCPPTADRGTFRKSPPYREGAKAYLECDPGYASNGVLFSELKRAPGGGLAWDPPHATCVPVTCPPPPYLEHGHADGHTYAFPHPIRFVCDPGYRLNVPLSTYHCAPTGEWSPRIPGHLACDLVQCPELPPLDYGVLKPPDERTVGSVARFTCFQGFRRTGPAERVCQADGTWSGDPVTCHPPQACVKLPEMVPVKTESPASVVLDCGNGREDTIMCLGNGQWSKLPPYCQDPWMDDDVEIIPVVPAKPKVKYNNVPKPLWKIHTIFLCMVALLLIIAFCVWSHTRRQSLGTVN